MLRYKILQSEHDKEVRISFDTSDIDKKYFSENDDFEVEINENFNLEKESYKPKNDYKLFFKFYKNSYLTDFAYAGFNNSEDFKKNVFKKSMFLLEFYINDTDKSRKFSQTLSVYPNEKSKKGCDILTGIISSTFTVNNPLNELYFLYNHRNFSNFENIKSFAGEDYSPMYMKAMFLNAKTGKAHYFILDKDNNNTVLNSGEFNDSLYYSEVRFFKDFTYGFYVNGVLVDNIYFKEVVVT